MMGRLLQQIPLHPSWQKGGQQIQNQSDRLMEIMDEFSI